MQKFTSYLRVSIAILLLSSLQLAAEECSFEQWIVDLQVATLDFVDHIDGPNALKKAEKLQNTADQNSLIALRTKLRKAGLGKHEALFKRFSARQKILLQSFRRSGAKKVRETGQIRKISKLLDEVESVVRKLDCADDPEWTPNSGSVSMYGLITNLHPAWNWGFLFLLVASFGGSLSLYSGYQQKLIRLNKRYPCNVDVSISLSNQTHTTACLDIGQTGMKVRLNSEYSLGTPCALQFGNTNWTGKIVWSNAEYSGVSFSKELEEKTLSGIVASSK